MGTAARVVMMKTGEPVPHSRPGAPEYRADLVPLLPAGQSFIGADGRTYRLPDAEELVRAFRARGRVPLPVDWEGAASVGAPLAGSVGDMAVVRGVQLWGEIDWTELGFKDVAEKAYRYIAPTFTYSDADLRITGIVSLSLVHSIENSPGAGLNRAVRSLSRTLD